MDWQAVRMLGRGLGGLQNGLRVRGRLERAGLRAGLHVSQGWKERFQPAKENILKDITEIFTGRHPEIAGTF